MDKVSIGVYMFSLALLISIAAITIVILLDSLF